MAKAKKAEKEKVEVELFPRFPRDLYKKGGDLVWGHGVKYSSINVKDEEEFDKAIKNGFIDSFEEALFGKASAEDKEEEYASEEGKFEEDDF